MKPPTPDLIERRRELGQHIRERRVEQQVSQEDLGHMAGLDRSYVGAVERGERNLGIDNLHRLADALGCAARDLL